MMVVIHFYHRRYNCYIITIILKPHPLIFLFALDTKNGIRSKNTERSSNSLAASPELHLPTGMKDGILPILMIACNRVTVSRSLDRLLE